MPINRSSAATFVVATVDSNAVGLVAFGFSADQVNTASRALIVTATGAAVRARWDNAGTAPTTTVGILLPLSYELVGNANIRRLQLIRDGSSSATVSIMLEND